MTDRSETRADQYRDLLEHWAAWWNGPGREHYRFNLLPPVTATGEALNCSICAGEFGEGRCAVCGRKMDR